MKVVLSLAVLLTSALWADEAADRAAIGATIAGLNTSPQRPGLFTVGFSNAAELENFKKRAALAPASTPALIPTESIVIESPAGTVVISREPMGEATWYPRSAAPSVPVAIQPRFVRRSVTFLDSKTANVVAAYARQSVLFVLKREGADWRIASFRVLTEARTNLL